MEEYLKKVGGAYETRTRDLLRDRQAFSPTELTHQTYLNGAYTNLTSGAYETRTRDLLRDRQAF